MRNPTANERADIIEHLQLAGGLDLGEAKGVLDRSHIGIVDSYMPDCPGAAGKIAMVVWPAGMEAYQVLRWRNGELEHVNQSL